MRTFYDALLAGAPVGEALRTAFVLQGNPNPISIDQKIV